MCIRDSTASLLRSAAAASAQGCSSRPLAPARCSELLTRMGLPAKAHVCAGCGPASLNDCATTADPPRNDASLRSAKSKSARRRHIGPPPDVLSRDKELLEQLPDGHSGLRRCVAQRFDSIPAPCRKPTRHSP
eukprot:1946611-Alexandrium_andersonii.AAC.1